MITLTFKIFNSQECLRKCWTDMAGQSVDLSAHNLCQNNIDMSAFKPLYPPEIGFGHTCSSLALKNASNVEVYRKSIYSRRFFLFVDIADILTFETFLRCSQIK